MKVTLKYEENENKELHMTLRLTLPQKYINGQCREVVKLFVDHYNKKHEENKLEMEVMHLKLVGGDHLDAEERVRDVIAGGDELYLLPESMRGKKQEAPKAVSAPAPSPSAPSKAPSETKVCPKVNKDADGKVRCKNFGCQNSFDPNGEPTPCTHHKAAPIFHETAKWWSCCPDRKAYDFEEFMRIPGCTTGTCSNEGQAKRAMGGCDMRAAMAANAPVRLDENAPVDGRVKLEDMRKGLIAVGVDGALFDKVLAQLFNETGNIDKVVEQFRMRFGAVLNNKDL
jgi:hypothetical protein